MVRHMILNSLRMYRQTFSRNMENLLSVMTRNITGGEITIQSIRRVERKLETRLVMIGMISLSFLI